MAVLELLLLVLLTNLEEDPALCARLAPPPRAGGQGPVPSVPWIWATPVMDPAPSDLTIVGSGKSQRRTGEVPETLAMGVGRGLERQV